eukprot:gene11149-18769_t
MVPSAPLLVVGTRWALEYASKGRHLLAKDMLEDVQSAADSMERLVQTAMDTQGLAARAAAADVWQGMSEDEQALLGEDCVAGVCSTSEQQVSDSLMELDGVGSAVVVSLHERAVWSEEFLACAQALGQWADVKAIVLEAAAGAGAGADASNPGAGLVRTFLRACLYDTDGSRQQIDLNQILTKDAAPFFKTEALQALLPVETVLSELCALDAKRERCRLAVDTALSQFLRRWSGLHPLSTAASGWQTRWPSVPGGGGPAEQSVMGGLLRSSREGCADSLMTLICARKIMLQAARKAAGAHSWGGEASKKAVDIALASERSLMQHGAHLACCCGLLDMSEKLLSPLLSEADSGGSAVASVPHYPDTWADLNDHVLCLPQLALVLKYPSGPGIAPSLDMQQLLAQASAHATLADWPEEGERQDKRDRVSKALRCLKEAADLGWQVTASTTGLLRDAAPTASLAPVLHGGHDGPPTNASLASIAAKASLEFALMCNRVLHDGAQVSRTPGTAVQHGSTSDSAGSGKKGCFPSKDELREEQKEMLKQGGGLTALVVKHLLRAMSLSSALGGRPSSLRFPLLLEVMGDNSSRSAAELQRAGEEFERQWRSVPLATYLPWTNQMLSRLTSKGPEAGALMPVLEALAAAYPQQLYCPVRIAISGLSPKDRGPQGAGPALSRLEQLSQSSVMADFVQARWDTYQASIERALGAGKMDEARYIYAEQAWPNLFGRYLAADTAMEAAADPGMSMLRGKPVGGSSAVSHGHASQPRDINSDFARKFGPLFQAAFGDDGRLLLSGRYSSARAFAEKAQELIAPAKTEAKARAGQIGRRDMATFSGWFKSFSNNYGASSAGPCLLLPAMGSVHAGGPLGGDESPPCIVGFGTLVHVFDSKQRPKRITVYCDDFRCYDFLAKGGEDAVYPEASVCARCLSRGIRLRTYEVIPLTPSLGLAGFVPNTRTLGEAIERAAADDKVARDENKVLTRGILEYRKCVYGPGGKPSSTSPLSFVYLDNFRKVSAASAIAGLNSVHAKMPNDLLREALLKSAGCPEIFIANRANFIRCLAACNTFGYIAGVGDRHLQNILIDESTGELVPIDFGYSFGTGTAALPIPELMPFRFTRQMRGALGPYDAQELMVAPMVAAMSALSEERQVLGSILTIFMREPLAELTAKHGSKKYWEALTDVVTARGLAHLRCAACFAKLLTPTYWGGHGKGGSRGARHGGCQLSSTWRHATSAAHAAMPPQQRMPPCHLSSTCRHATSAAHAAMPPQQHMLPCHISSTWRHATSAAHGAMPPQQHMAPCHLSSTFRHATSAAHAAMPPQQHMPPCHLSSTCRHATSAAHAAMPPQQHMPPCHISSTCRHPTSAAHGAMPPQQHMAPCHLSSTWRHAIQPTGKDMGRVEALVARLARQAAEEAARLAKKKDDKERSQSRLQIYNDLKTKAARIVAVKAMDGTDSIPNNIEIPDLKKRFLNTAWEMIDLKTAAKVVNEGVTTVLHAVPLGTNT